jgi:Ca-activated chloride channel homolog
MNTTWLHRVAHTACGLGGFFVLLPFFLTAACDTLLPKKDDWSYGSEAESTEKNKVSLPSAMSGGAMAKKGEMLGFSVGGAKDVGNFRENIKNKYLPQPTDMTYEGLFYDYYFDTGKTEECQKLFCPSYSYALSSDPLSRVADVYLSVGLNSGIKESDFARKMLNIVVVLDISGSMGSAFNSYYYDQFGSRHDNTDQDAGAANKAKIQVATESIVALLDHLQPHDSFGMVLFDSTGYLAKPISSVGTTDMPAIRQHILTVKPRGGTNFEAGYKLGASLFDSGVDRDCVRYENRIIFLTDAMPNIGNTSDSGLLGLSKTQAARGVYSTFIGMGVDFNSALIERITKIRGANYYSVHSSKQFKKRLADEFDFMVTPLVFDLLLKLDAPGYEIEKIYGSPEANEGTGELMKVNTLFPSKTEAGETRGGLVLLKLRKKADNASLTLATSYEDRSGKRGGEQQTISIDPKQLDQYPNSGIRKGILLARYADLMKNWMIDETTAYQQKKPVRPSIDEQRGIQVPNGALLSKWERQSIPLQVAPEYRKLFTTFKEYFRAEMQAINDLSLGKEMELLNTLATYSEKAR